MTHEDRIARLERAVSNVVDVLDVLRERDSYPDDWGTLRQDIAKIRELLERKADMVTR